MQSKTIRFFTDSAGALLLAMATAIFVSIGSASGWVPLRDPLFQISITVVFWIVGAAELTVGLVCLFGKQASLKATLILWLAINFLVYQLGLCCFVGPHSFIGYWGNLAVAFHVASGTSSGMLTTVFVYLLIGSIVSLLWPSTPKPQDNAESCLTVSCSTCGSPIEFPVQGIVQEIVCPHCATAITLKKPV